MDKELIYNPTSCYVDETNSGNTVKDYVVYVSTSVQRYPLYDSETQRHNALAREEGEPGGSKPTPVPGPTPDPSPGPDPSPSPTPDPSVDPADDPSSWEYDGDKNGVPDTIDTIQKNNTWSVI